MQQTSTFYSPSTIRAGWMRNTFIALVTIGLFSRIVIRVLFAELDNPELWEFSPIANNVEKYGIFASRSGIFTAFMPPFYPIFIGVIYDLFGRDTYASHFVLSLFLWLVEFAIPFVMGWLGTRIWNLRVGQFAFLLALFWPMLLMTSGRLLNVPLYTLLPMLSVAIMLSDMRRWKRIVLIGLTMGLLWNNRFETPLFMLPFAYYIFFFDKDRVTGQLPPVATRIAAVGALAAILILCISPWVIRNMGIYGKPVLSTEGGYHFRRGHHEGATGTGRDPWPTNQGTRMAEPPAGAINANKRSSEFERLRAIWHREQALAWIKANPERELQLIGLKLYYFLVTDFTHPYARSWVIWPASLVALILGFFYWVRTGVWDPRQQVLWTLFGIQLMLCIAFIVLPRFRVAVEWVPMLFFAAWLANGRLGTWFNENVSVQQAVVEDNSH